MKMNRRQVLKAGLAASTVYSPWMIARAQARPVKLAAILPLTGAFAFAGNAALDAFRDAADRINDAGGIGGRRFELVVDGRTALATDGSGNGPGPGAGGVGTRMSPALSGPPCTSDDGPWKSTEPVWAQTAAGPTTTAQAARTRTCRIIARPSNRERPDGQRTRWVAPRATIAESSTATPPARE